MTKEEARQLFLKKRQELSLKEIQNGNLQISETFFQNIVLKEIQNLQIFLTIDRQIEVNTDIIIQKIRKEHPQIKISVPVVSPNKKFLINSLLEPHSKLILNRWGIPEPIPSIPLSLEIIQIIILPMIICDMNGNRIGYGKGFYDEMIKKCSRNVLKIGINFFEPIDKISNIDVWDEPLDCCVWPGTFKFFKHL